VAVTPRPEEGEALQYADVTLTYDELNRRANRLAHYLRTRGVGPDVRVGICVEREPELVVAVMNPFDPDMQMPPGTGFGLNSVKRRLYLLFGRNDLVEINKSQNSFVVIFRIPDINA